MKKPQDYQASYRITIQTQQADAKVRKTANTDANSDVHSTGQTPTDAHTAAGHLATLANG